MASSGGVVLVIPSLGATTLADCLRSASNLEPAPDHTVVVLSGGAVLPAGSPRVDTIRSGHRLGFAHIDALDERVRVRAADDSPVEHTGAKLQVVGEERLARHLFKCIDSLDAFANRGWCFVVLRICGHHFPPLAAAWIESMMPT